MKPYCALPFFYDRFMAHVDYNAWVTFILRAMGFAPGPLGRAGSRVSSVANGTVLLDLACGTGTIAIKLARLGYRVIGIDRSPEMLAVADAKANDSGVGITWSCQDLTGFEVGTEADGAICVFNSLNYLTEEGALAAAFQRVSASLKPGAPFLFDLHTEARFRRFDEETYAEIEDDVAYIWVSEYDEARRVCTMDLTLFVEAAGGPSDEDAAGGAQTLDTRSGYALGTYTRYDETHVERAYTDEEVRAALSRGGMRLEGRWGELRMEPPRADEERIFYLARKVAAGGSAG